MYRTIVGISIVYLALTQTACNNWLLDTSQLFPDEQQQRQAQKQQPAQYQGMTGNEYQDQCRRLGMMIMGYPMDCSSSQVGPQPNQSNYDAGEVCPT